MGIAYWNICGSMVTITAFSHYSSNCFFHLDVFDFFLICMTSMIFRIFIRCPDSIEILLLTLTPSLLIFHLLSAITPLPHVTEYVLHLLSSRDVMVEEVAHLAHLREAVAMKEEWHWSKVASSLFPNYFHFSLQRWQFKFQGHLLWVLPVDYLSRSSGSLK